MSIHAYPLTAIQEGMLFHTLYTEHAGVYTQQFVWQLNEAIHHINFSLAWKKVIQRHAILRTSFHWLDPQEPPVQHIHADIDIQCEIHAIDWYHDTPQQQDKKFQQFLIDDRKADLPLDQFPTMRFALIRLAKQKYKFVWTYHHALLDGRSRFSILKEVFAYYYALQKREDLELPLPPCYSQYLHWLTDYNHDKSIPFWENYLKNVVAPTPLPFCLPQYQTGNELSHEEMTMTVDRALTEQLTQAVAEWGISLNTLIQITWTTILYRYSQEQHIVFGATRACRHFDKSIQSKNMVGLFINTLPIALTVDDTTTPRSLFNVLNNYSKEIRAHEHTPPVMIQNCSRLPQGAALFESIIVFENYDVNDSLREQSAQWEKHYFYLLQHTHYPLVLSVKAGHQLALSLEYAVQKFTPSFIKQLLNHCCTILKNLPQQLDTPLSLIPLLTQEEQYQICHTWNNTFDNTSLEGSFLQYFSHYAQTSPDHIAVTDSTQQLSYQQLDMYSNQVAHYLHHQGVKAGDFVALAMHRSVDMLVGLLGILKACACYIPIDPSYPLQRVHYMLENSETEFLLTQVSLSTQLPKLPNVKICLFAYKTLANYPFTPPIQAPEPSQLSYVIYTSGSTGKPKGVQISHRALHNFLISMRDTLEITAEDTLLAITTISFDIAALELYLPLIIGGKIVIAATEDTIDGIRLLSLIDQHQVKFMQATPATWHLLIAAGWQKNSLHTLLCGGEPLPQDLITQISLRNVTLWNMYGPTETTIWSTCHKISATDKFISIGKPIANTSTYVLDQHFKPVPIGVTGELYIGGTGISKGYLNRPELTAERFIDNPFDDREGVTQLYRTGDWARYHDNGELECLGRADSQVKLRGFRIELGEIEYVLAQHPAIKQAVVMIYGEQKEQSLIAYYTHDIESEPLNIAALQQFLQDYLPRYMLPSRFILLDELPLTPNGKIDRRALPKPENEHTATHDMILPRNPLELKLCRIWQDVLTLSHVGVTDNFFDLGGHSLIAIRLINQISKHFQQRLPLTTLFKHPTIAQLAYALQNEGVQYKPSNIVNLRSGENRAHPFFCIHPIGGHVYAYLPFVQGLENTNFVYGIQALGFNQQETPLTDIPTMAAYYLRQIEAKYMTGTYQLIGWSLGGVIAFEMARQLTEQGKEVGLVCLLDSYLPPAQEAITELDLYQAFAKDLGLSISIPETDSAEKKLHTVFIQAQQADIIPLDMDDVEFEQLFSVFKNNHTALSTYQTKPYQGDVVFFSAGLRTHVRDPIKAWQPWVTGQLHVHTINSTHYDILNTEYLPEIHKVLSKYITVYS